MAPVTDTKVLYLNFMPQLPSFELQCWQDMCFWGFYVSTWFPVECLGSWFQVECIIMVNPPFCSFCSQLVHLGPNRCKWNR